MRAFLLLLGLLGSALLVAAAPATLRPLRLVQPDGSAFHARRWGDAFLNGWSYNNRTITKDEQGWWTYADLGADNKLHPTHLRVVDSSKMTKRHAEEVEQIAEHISPIYPRGIYPDKSPYLRHLRAVEAAPVVGERYFLTVLVDFNDAKIKYSVDRWSNEIFGTQPRSAKTFIYEASFGKLTIKPPVNNQGTVKISVNTNHPNIDIDKDEYSANLETVIQTLADTYDIAQYDANQDKILQNTELAVIFIYAGYEESQTSGLTPKVWAHASEFKKTFKAQNGENYRLAQYMAVGELVDDDKPSLTSTIIHEYGHDLGQTDLYDSSPDPKKHSGVGEWSMMAGGSNAGKDEGVEFDIWTKAAFGWLPTENLQVVLPDVNVPSVELQPADKATPGASGIFAVQILDNPRGFSLGGQAGEYFLLEFRRQQGRDLKLPGCGVILWHVDEAKSTNQNARHKLLDVVEADGKKTLDTSNSFAGKPGDVFPGPSKVTSFPARKVKAELYNKKLPSSFSITFPADLTCDSETATISITWDSSRSDSGDSTSSDDSDIASAEQTRDVEEEKNVLASRGRQNDPYAEPAEQRRLLGKLRTNEKYQAGALPCCTVNPNGKSCDKKVQANCVCAQDPYCCEVQWDSICVAKMNDLGCGNCPITVTGPNDCCTPAATPGCVDHPTAMTVCAQDNYCCTVKWDESCVDLATELTDQPCAEKDIASSFTKRAVTNDCCSPATTPLCADEATAWQVCAESPFCCANKWDKSCALRARQLTKKCPDITSGIGTNANKESCCTTHASTGCNDAAVTKTVCAKLPQCCLIGWNTDCIAAAPYATCKAVLPMKNKGLCTDAGTEGGCADVAMRDRICTTDSYCCSTSWDSKCAVKALKATLADVTTPTTPTTPTTTTPATSSAGTTINISFANIMK